MSYVLVGLAGFLARHWAPLVYVGLKKVVTSAFPALKVLATGSTAPATPASKPATPAS